MRTAAVQQEHAMEDAEDGEVPSTDRRRQPAPVDGERHTGMGRGEPQTGEPPRGGIADSI